MHRATIEIEGRLVADPEIKDKVMRFTVASDVVEKSEQGSWIVKETIFFSCALYAEHKINHAASILSKGVLVMVTGTYYPKLWGSEGKEPRLWHNVTVSRVGRLSLLTRTDKDDAGSNSIQSSKGDNLPF